MRKKNQTRKWKQKRKKKTHSSDSSISLSSSSDCSSDSRNAHARIRTKENDNYKKRSRRSHSPSRDRTKSKRQKIEGSVRKGTKSKLKEKRKKKKKEKLRYRGRDTSVSSEFTPGSQSCSTCRSSSSENIGRGRSSKARRSLSRSKKNRKYNERGRSRSPIYSSSDGSIRSHRLERIGEKSSLTLSKETDRRYDFDTEVGSMEVSTKDHLDFSSSKKNGNFDGSNGRKSAGSLERYAGTDYCVEGEEKDASFVDYVSNEERSGPSMRIKSIVVVSTANDAKEENLESLLRQKALENLKKFRGKSCSLSAQSSDHRNVDDLESQLPAISKGRVCIEKELGGDGCSDGINTTFKENVNLSIGDKVNVKDENHRVELSGDTAAKPLKQIVSLTRTMEKRNGGEFANPPSSSSSQPGFSRLSSSHTSNIKKYPNSLNQVRNGQDNQNDNLSKQSSVKCGISEMEDAVQSNIIHQGSTSKTSSTIDENSRQENANEPKTDVRHDSGLEEKTMTVMRGGEMVQV